MNFQDLKKKILDKLKQEKEEKALQKEREKFHKKILAEEKKRSKEEKSDTSGAFLSLKHINKIYDNHVQAVFDFNLDVAKHEFIVLVGPSGCGKSTTLRMIAGLEEITSGDLYIDGIYANQLPPKDRNIGMVFQSYALYPHMTVYENMAFALKVNHVKKDEIEKRVLNAAKILQITDYLNRKPNALSGGQCQRVALGRAIVRDAKVFLMDEPLSNLDAKLRVQMRSEIVKLHKALDTTTIFVTHDQTEAMTMASRIVVMNKGYVQQIGTPEEIYSHPANIFVATFIGSPAMNIMKTKLVDNKLKFDNNYEIDLGDDFKKTLSDFYKEEIKKQEKKIDNYKDLYFDRFLASHSYKALKRIDGDFSEVNKLASKLNLEGKENFDAEHLELAKNLIYIETAKNYINQLSKNDSENAEFVKESLQNLDILLVNEDKFDEINASYLIFIKEYLYLNSAKTNPNIQKLNKLIEELKSVEKNGTKEVLFGIRPEDVELGQDEPYFESTIDVRELLGSEYYIHFDFSGQTFISKLEVNQPLKEGEKISVYFKKDKIHIFDPLTEERIL